VSAAGVPDDLAAANRALVAEFRAAGRSLPGRPLLLLTTTGARSGQPRTNPMMYVRLDDRLLVIASAAGSPRHPDWYHNLVAHPDTVVEYGTETFDVTARLLTGDERDEVYAKQVEVEPQFGDYQRKTERVIPVFELQRVGG